MDELGFDISDTSALERSLFTCVNEDNKQLLESIFLLHPSPTTILQILMTTTYPNRDNFYRHDQEVIKEAEELLGPSLENLNAMHIAVLLGHEDVAIAFLDFVIKITDEIQAKKVLYEFMGRVWGDGNTTLHLASFMGMNELVTIMIELGAATGKSNNQKYKPVDCAGDDLTRNVFETVVEVDRSVRKLVVDCPLNFTEMVSPVFKTAPEQFKNAESPRKHSKSASLDGKAVKGRSSRSGTLSNQQFPIHILARSSSTVDKPKSKKSVRFDPGTLLLHLCQFSESGDTLIKSVSECLGLTSDNQKATLDVNNTYSPQQWLTPLHVASSHGHMDIVLLLLQNANAAVNIRDKEGWTPLHCAAAEGHIDMIRLLGRCQGNLESERVDNNCIYVLDGPIELDPLNDEGDSPEDVALEAKAVEIKALLRDLKIKFPPPVRKEVEEEISEEEEEEEELVREEELIISPKDNFLQNLKRSPSVIRQRNTHHLEEHKEEHREEEEESPKVAPPIPPKYVVPLAVEEPCKIDSEIVEFPSNTHLVIDQIPPSLTIAIEKSSEDIVAPLSLLQDRKIKPRKGSWGRLAPKIEDLARSPNGGEQLKRADLQRRNSKSSSPRVVYPTELSAVETTSLGSVASIKRALTLQGKKEIVVETSKEGGARNLVKERMKAFQL